MSILPGRYTKKKNIARKTKNSKKPSKFLRFLGSKRALVLGFVLIFGGIGTYMLLQSFAATEYITVSANDLVSQPDQIIIQKHKNYPHNYSLDALSEYYAPEFLLYGDGRLLCGTSGSAILKTTNLTRPQIVALFEQIKLSGFGKLDRYYADNDSEIDPHKGTVIAVNFNQGAKTVRYYGPTVAKPAGFSQTEKLLSARCALATQVYAPATMRVGFKKSSGVAIPWNLAVAPFPKLTQNIEYLSFGGTQAQQILKLMAGASQKLFRAPSGQIYEVRTYPDLPVHQAPVERIAEAKPPSFTVKLPTFIEKAEATGTGVTTKKQVIILWHHSNDDALSTNALRLPDHATSIQGFYTREVGKTFTMLEPEVVDGKHDSNDYKSCDATDAWWRHCTDGEDAIMFNLSDEYTQYRGAEALLFFTELSVNNRSCGGLGYQDGFKGIGDIGAVFNSEVCLEADLINRLTMTKAAGAHELGHAFHLEHVFNGTIMGSRYAGDDGTCDQDFDTKCQLDKNQASSLKDSPYFNVAEVTTGSLPGIYNYQVHF